MAVGDGSGHVGPHDCTPISSPRVSNDLQNLADPLQKLGGKPNGGGLCSGVSGRGEVSRRGRVVPPLVRRATFRVIVIATAEIHWGAAERHGQRSDIFGCGPQAAANNLTNDFDECVAVLETKSIRLRERIAHRFVSAA